MLSSKLQNRKRSANIRSHTHKNTHTHAQTKNKKQTQIPERPISNSLDSVNSDHCLGIFDFTSLEMSSFEICLQL